MTARTLTFTGPHSVHIEESSVPDPDPNQILVRAHTSAISAGTELLVYRDEATPSLPADETLDALPGTLSFPTQYGYATVGKVIDVGKRVSSDWKETKVFAYHPHASHFVISPDNVIALPDSLSDETGVFLANLEAAVNFMLDGSPRIGEHTLILGQGIVGLLTTALLSQFPVRSIFTTDLYADRREISRLLGATKSIDPATTNGLQVIYDEVPLRGNKPGVDLAYELTGNPATLETAIEYTGYGGRVLVGSWYGKKPVNLTLDGRFHRSRISLRSTQVSTITPELTGRWSISRRRQTALRCLESIPTEKLISHRFRIEDAAEAYALLDTHPENALQVLLTY